MSKLYLIRCWLMGSQMKCFDPQAKSIKERPPFSLSPFLFLLCTEGLHNLISKAESEGSIHGFALSRRSPKLTHLLFTEDSLLFCRSNKKECHKVLEILATYEHLSCQQINRGKTSLFFSKSTTEAIR